MFPRILARVSALAAFGLVLWSDTASPAHATAWKPVTAEELALAAPRIDPSAGAEILFRETEIDDTAERNTTTHTYVRLKVFNGRGVAPLDRIEIVEPRDGWVYNIAARVIRPDGSIVAVDNNTIYARVVVKRAWSRQRVKTFTFPALEPGCIVEYQWDEDSEVALGGRQLYFQDQFPAWRVQFRVRPYDYADRGYELKAAGFRYEIPELVPDHRGFYTFAQTDVPALREEPWMPPDDMVQSWVVLYFLREGQTADRYWEETARTLARDVTRRTRPTPELEAQARALHTAAADEREQLRRYAAFCRDQIRNRTEQLATDPGAALAPRPTGGTSAVDVLRAGAGSAGEINLLFLALARAGGFEARLALVTDRSQRMFETPLPARFMLPDEIAAVRLDGAWQFFDPGSRFAAAGALSWRNEGVTALVCDRDQPEFLQTPRRPREDSRIARTARLTMDETGQVTGTIVVASHGHCAEEARQEFADATPEQRAALIYTRESRRLPGPEMTGVAIAHATDADAPLLLSYRVRVPHYATAAGGRLLFPLAYFQHGRPRAFTARQRRHVIYQPFEFVEDDLVELTLPDGYHLEDASAPAALALPPALDFRGTLATAADDSRVTYRRVVAQGGMLFSARTYRLIQRAFADLHRADAQTVVAQRAAEDGGRKAEDRGKRTDD